MGTLAAISFLRMRGARLQAKQAITLPGQTETRTQLVVHANGGLIRPQHFPHDMPPIGRHLLPAAATYF
jgi:hypothetical protein